MRALLPDCQFNNCMHINEPGCAVKDAAEHGRIAMERYISYYSILETIDDKNY
jgi:ribosome biogenesis GTPase